MSVSEVRDSFGEWTVTLSAATPREILDAIDYFGHICVTSGRTDFERYGDSVLADASYAGVLRSREFGSGSKVIGGPGMLMWLGDEDNKGHGIENELNFTAAGFHETLTALTPPTLQVGTIHPIAGTYTGKHRFQSPREAYTYVTELFGAEYRVNFDGTIDAGTPEQLYPQEPTAAILRKVSEGGVDMHQRALPGEAKLDSDMEDFSTRLVTIGESDEVTAAVGSADIPPERNPYKDLFGNTLKMTRFVQEQNTSLINADARAQVHLNQYIAPHEKISLNTYTHDVKGDLAIGGFVWVEDEEAKLVDEENLVEFKGMRLYPVKLRVLELSWPIVPGMGVGYRHWNGTWINLTPYVEFENGATTVVVGEYNRSLTGASGYTPGTGTTGGPGQPSGDALVPGVPVLETPIRSGSYLSPNDGLSRARVDLIWAEPLNTDGSLITDGAWYVIRFRTSANAIYPATHEDLSDKRHDQLSGPHESPEPFTTGAWNYINVPWGIEEYTLLDLTPGIPYDFSIRAVDTATPANVSAWSDTVVVQTQPDVQPPPAPAPAEVAASRIAIQVLHRLGTAGLAGEFNLPSDLNHFEVHISYEPTFEPVEDSVDLPGGTLLGKMPATISELVSNTPVVATFQVESTDELWVKMVAVDNNGNRSNPSEAVQQTAELIDDAHISNLTVTKVTAGSITSDWVHAANITTRVNSTGPGLDFGFHGLEVFNSLSQLVVDINSSDGSMYMVGTVETGKTGRRIRMDGGANEIRFYPQFGETRFGRLISYIPGNFPNDIAIEMRSYDSDTTGSLASFGRAYVMPDRAVMAVAPQGNEEVATSQFTATEGFAQTEALVIEAGPPITSVMRARHLVHNNGNVYTDVYGTSGARTGGMRIGNFSGYLASLSNDNFFGGYANWDSFGMEVGAHLSGTSSRAYFDTNHFEMYHANSQRFNSVNDGVESYGSNGFFSFRFAGLGNIRARLATTDYGDIQFVARPDTGALAIYTAAGSWVKNFVIDHPQDPENKYLVHGCTEAPHAGVEYWGIATVEDGEAEVTLPPYFESLTQIENRVVILTVLAEQNASDRLKLERKKPRRERKRQPEVRVPAAVQSDDAEEQEFEVLPPLADPPPGVTSVAMATEPRDGRFFIYSDQNVETMRVMWLVKAIRKDVPPLVVEPNKADVTVHGAGPYTYIEENADA